MDSSALLSELIKKLHELSNTCMQKHIGESLKGEMLLLQFLVNQGGSSLPSHLSESMNVSSARIAAVLNSLCKKGFVRRKPDPTDRRKKAVFITEAGFQYALQQRRYLRDIMLRILEGLGETDAREYIRIVGRIIEISKEEAAPACESQAAGIYSVF